MKSSIAVATNYNNIIKNIYSHCPNRSFMNNVFIH